MVRTAVVPAPRGVALSVLLVAIGLATSVLSTGASAQNAANNRIYPDPGTCENWMQICQYTVGNFNSRPVRITVWMADCQNVMGGCVEIAHDRVLSPGEPVTFNIMKIDFDKPLAYQVYWNVAWADDAPASAAPVPTVRAPAAPSRPTTGVVQDDYVDGNSAQARAAERARVAQPQRAQAEADRLKREADAARERERLAQQDQQRQLAAQQEQQRQAAAERQRQAAVAQEQQQQQQRAQERQQALLQAAAIQRQQQEAAQRADQAAQAARAEERQRGAAMLSQEIQRTQQQFAAIQQTSNNLREEQDAAAAREELDGDRNARQEFEGNLRTARTVSDSAHAVQFYLYTLRARQGSAEREAGREGTVAGISQGIGALAQALTKQQSSAGDAGIDRMHRRQAFLQQRAQNLRAESDGLEQVLAALREAAADTSSNASSLASLSETTSPAAAASPPPGAEPAGATLSQGQAGGAGANRVLDAAQSLLHDPARDQRLGAELQSNMQEDEVARARAADELKAAATAADSTRLVQARIAALRTAADRYDRRARPSVGSILQTAVTVAAVFDQATSGHSSNAADAGTADLDRDSQRRDAFRQQAQRLREEAARLEAVSWSLNRSNGPPAGEFPVTSRGALTCDGLPSPAGGADSGTATLRYTPGRARYRIDTAMRVVGQVFVQHMVISTVASDAHGNLALAVTVDSFALPGPAGALASVQAVRGRTLSFILTPSGDAVSSEPADSTNPILMSLGAGLPRLFPHLPGGPISAGSAWSDTAAMSTAPGVVGAVISDHRAVRWVSRNGGRALQVATTSFNHVSGSVTFQGGSLQMDGAGRSARDALISADGELLGSVQRDSMTVRSIMPNATQSTTSQTASCTTVTRLP